MTKGVKWVTLTPEERRMVQPPSWAASSSSGSSGSGNRSLAKLHVCEVQLPDRTTCRVTYQRDNAQWHRFQFTAPLHQRLYANERPPSSEEAIEAKAQTLAPQAYAQAQQAEQKEMQRSTPPPGRRADMSPSLPLLRPKTAQAQAGQYTLCVAFPSGNLMPIGRLLHTNAQSAVQEWEQEVQHREETGGRQSLVVGICCRWQRRWIRARFVVYPQNDPNADSRANLSHSRTEPDPEESDAEEAGTRTTTATFAAGVSTPTVEASEAQPPAPTTARTPRKRTKQTSSKTTPS